MSARVRVQQRKKTKTKTKQKKQEKKNRSGEPPPHSELSSTVHVAGTNQKDRGREREGGRRTAAWWPEGRTKIAVGTDAQHK